MIFELCLASIVIIACVVHRITTKKAQYFAERNLKYICASDALRNISDLIYKKIDIFELVQRTYNKFPDEP